MRYDIKTSPKLGTAQALSFINENNLSLKYIKKRRVIMVYHKTKLLLIVSSITLCAYADSLVQKSVELLKKKEYENIVKLLKKNPAFNINGLLSEGDKNHTKGAHSLLLYTIAQGDKDGLDALLRARDNTVNFADSVRRINNRPPTFLQSPLHLAYAKRDEDIFVRLLNTKNPDLSVGVHAYFDEQDFSNVTLAAFIGFNDLTMQSRKKLMGDGLTILHFIMAGPSLLKALSPEDIKGNTDALLYDAFVWHPFITLTGDGIPKKFYTLLMKHSAMTADVINAGKTYLTPLEVAFVFKNYDMAKDLLSDPRIRVNAQSNKKNSALHTAAKLADKKAVDLLFDTKLLAQRASTKIFSSLSSTEKVHYCVDPNAKNSAGKTALLVALTVTKPSEGFIKHLYGACKEQNMFPLDIQVQDDKGMTALAYAQKLGKKGLIKLFSK